MDQRFKLATGRGRVEHYEGLFTTSTTDGYAISAAADTFGGSLTIARTAVGKITITFPVKVEKVFSYDAKLHLTSASNTKFAQVDSFTIDSSGKAVMVIGLYTTATATDLAGKVTWSCDVRR